MYIGHMYLGRKRGACRKSRPLGPCLFFRKVKKQVWRTKPDDRARQPDPTGGPDKSTKHQDRRPADTSGRTKPRKRTHTPRGTTTQKARKPLFSVSRVRLEKQRTGGTSAPLVPFLLPPPLPEPGSLLLSEAAQTFFGKFFFFC